MHKPLAFGTKPNYIRKSYMRFEVLINSDGQQLLKCDGYYCFVFKDKLEHLDLSKILNGIDMVSDDSEDKDLILADVTGLKNVSIRSRRMGVDWIAQNKSRKRIAVLARTVFMYHFVAMIIKGTKNSNRMRIFKERRDAVQWLRK